MLPMHGVIVARASLGACFAAALSLAAWRTPSHAEAALPEIAVAELPREARDVLALIRAGGPFRYERDGVVFGNRERMLPRSPRLLSRVHGADARARRTAARGASSAAGRERRPTLLLHRRPLPDRLRGSANEAARPRRSSTTPACMPWTGAVEPLKTAAAHAQLRFAIVDLAQGEAIARRCSRSSTARSSCPSISATTGTRSPTCSRTATGSARHGIVDRAHRTRPRYRTRPSDRLDDARGHPRRGLRVLEGAARGVLGVRRLNVTFR